MDLPFVVKSHDRKSKPGYNNGVVDGRADAISVIMGFHN